MLAGQITGLQALGVLGGQLFRPDGACCSGGACDLAANGPGVPDPRRAENAYVTGETYSSDFPAVVGPDTSHNGGADAFVARVGYAGHKIYLPLVLRNYR